MLMNHAFSKSFICVVLFFTTLFNVYPQSTHTEKIEAKWMSLLPNIGIAQYAGNIGFLSMGIGWDYGKDNKWETHLLLGYLPHFTFGDDAFTLTIREQYIPFTISISDMISLSPSNLSLSMNAVMNDEFWFTEPINNNYYRFSSKVRSHLGIGSRLNFYVPSEKKRRFARISLYYELSTYDLAIISIVRNRYVPFHDILSLGVGLNVSIY